MNEKAFSVIKLIQSQQLSFDHWEILDVCQSTKQMFGTNFDFELVGKWIILFFDTAEEVLSLFNLNILPQPSMVLKTHYGKETAIYCYPCDDNSSHFLLSL